VWFKEGSNWYSSDGGTATLPTDSDASYTIASPNNLKLLGVLSYTTADMIMQGMFTIGEAYSKHMPHGWSLVIVNYSGAAIAASGSIVWYAPLFKQKIA
jgi:hypothetical protein